MTPQFSVFTALLSGVIVSFTPCAYPLIPVTMGVIGNMSGGSRKRGFFYSFVYVTGIALTYTILGMAAALGGKMFGLVQTNPYVNLGVGLFFFVFALSFLGVYDLPFVRLIKTVRPQSLLMLLVTGMVSGLVISPCTSPVLGAILIYAGTQGDVLKGGLLLFSFAMGMGTVLILAGTFSSFFPRSGKWLAVTEKILGAVLLAGAGYFIYQFWRLK
ncbi:MAG TPA: cytochrome c biogenesis protein CcdA [bacterium]|nr:cytochrome c biogenesis protein CcdA [bacterium]